MGRNPGHRGHPHVGGTVRPAGLPARSARLLQRYATATAADLDALPWYTGLFCFKLAGIFFRETEGMTVGEGLGELAGLGPAVAAGGHRALDEGGRQFSERKV